MTNYEASLRMQVGNESAGMRELRQYARSELNSSVESLLSDCERRTSSVYPRVTRTLHRVAALFF